MINNVKVKQYIRNKGFKSSGDFVEKLEEDLIVVLDRAIERAEENQRKTIYPRDL